MRIFLGILTVALLAAWGPVGTAQAQCEPSTCAGWGAKKPKAAKQVAKKQTKPAKQQYMRIAP